MKKRIIDENDLRKLSEEEFSELDADFSINLTSNDKDQPDYSLGYTLSREFTEDERVKIRDGFYYIEGNVYLSIWSYKKYKMKQFKNDTQTNFEDAKALYNNELVTDTIEVITHSPNFPKVNGYLEEDLDFYFQDRDYFLSNY
jgi:hypothetical protein